MFFSVQRLIALARSFIMPVRQLRIDKFDWLMQKRHPSSRWRTSKVNWGRTSTKSCCCHDAYRKNTDKKQLIDWHFRYTGQGFDATSSTRSIELSSSHSDNFAATTLSKYCTSRPSIISWRRVTVCTFLWQLFRWHDLQMAFCEQYHHCRVGVSNNLVSIAFSVSLIDSPNSCLMKSPETSGRAFYCRCIVFCMGTKANDESIADHHPGLIPPSSLDRSWVDMQRVSPINVIFDFETLRGIAWRTKPRKAKLLAVHRPQITGSGTNFSLSNLSNPCAMTATGLCTGPTSVLLLKPTMDDVFGLINWICQPSYRHDERPGESYEALDGKKISNPCAMQMLFIICGWSFRPLETEPICLWSAKLHHPRLESNASVLVLCSQFLSITEEMRRQQRHNKPINASVRLYSRDDVHPQLQLQSTLIREARYVNWDSACRWWSIWGEASADSTSSSDSESVLRKKTVHVISSWNQPTQGSAATRMVWSWGSSWGVVADSHKRSEADSIQQMQVEQLPVFLWGRCCLDNVMEACCGIVQSPASSNQSLAWRSTPHIHAFFVQRMDLAWWWYMLTICLWLESVTMCWASSCRSSKLHMIFQFNASRSQVMSWHFWNDSIHFMMMEGWQSNAWEAHHPALQFAWVECSKPE